MQPKTCRTCGETFGEKAEHTYLSATCTEPEICVCGKENLYSEPLGHDWIAATLSTPMTCARCGTQNGQPVPLSSLNRGRYDKKAAHPSASDYIGVNGYVAAAYETYLYPSSTSPHENNWLESPWFVTVYKKDKQFFNAVGTIEHKTPVIVVDQELIDDGDHKYDGFLLIERIDTGEQYYISVVDFVVEPYWESIDMASIPYASPCLAVYHQNSSYYPVDRNERKATITDGDLVFIFGNTSWAGIDDTTNQIDGLTDNGRAFFNVDDLTIIY